MHIVCALCGTDSPSVIYYVGQDESHCGDCWSILFHKLMNTQINFNIDATVDTIEDRMCNAPLEPNPEPEADTKVIPVYAGAVEFISGVRKYDWFNRVQPHYNYGADRP